MVINPIDVCRADGCKPSYVRPCHVIGVSRHLLAEITVPPVAVAPVGK